MPRAGTPWQAKGGAPDRPITIGGLPGTGTTTACRKIAEITGLTHHYTGQIFRDMAKERNLTLEAFGRYAEEHAEVDRELDDRQVELLKGGPVLLEGRLAGFLSQREGIPAFKVWFHAQPYVRAERVVRREGGDVEDRMAQMREREASERKRYLKYYGFDVNELGIYDMVVDTTEKTPMEIVGDVLDVFRRPARRWFEFWNR